MSEAFGPDFITLTDEDGQQFELELIDSLEHNGTVYHALFPAEQEGEEQDEEEMGLVILKVIEENGEELLSTPDSDEELDGILASPRARAICDGFSQRRPSEALCRRCGFAERFNR